MKAIIQRVVNAQCTVDGVVTGAVEFGLLVYVGFGPNDTTAAVDWMVDRVRKMRIFEDENGKMNRSVQDVCGDVLWVPNFTLYCDASSRRPSFSGAMPFQQARALFDYLKQSDIRFTGHGCQTGVFGADMRVTSTCLGPINVEVQHDE